MTIDDTPFDQAALCGLVCVPLLPVAWAMCVLLAPFLLVGLLGFYAHRAWKERQHVRVLREVHKTRPVEWHAGNFVGVVRMLGGTNDDIPAYIRVKQIEARYFRNNPLHDMEDGWWDAVYQAAKRTGKS